MSVLTEINRERAKLERTTGEIAGALEGARDALVNANERLAPLVEEDAIDAEFETVDVSVGGAVDVGEGNAGVEGALDVGEATVVYTGDGGGDVSVVDNQTDNIVIEGTL